MAYDVLTKGGRVIDPASKTYRPLDLAIQGGRIARVLRTSTRRRRPRGWTPPASSSSPALRLWRLFTSWL